MAFAGGIAVLGDRLVMGLDQRIVDTAQDFHHHRIFGTGDLGHRGDRLGPARRGGRYFAAVLVVLVDVGDDLGEVALQGRVFGHVALQRGIHTAELALDDVLAGLAALSQQHLAVALGNP